MERERERAQEQVKKLAFLFLYTGSDYFVVKGPTIDVHRTAPFLCPTRRLPLLHMHRGSLPSYCSERRLVRRWLIERRKWVAWSAPPSPLSFMERLKSSQFEISVVCPNSDN
uniref:Uncharacterized protein n=1 Tax=Manihot esculenta TaxID=3983 RepID=A0A2C9VCT1_MANES